MAIVPIRNTARIGQYNTNRVARVSDSLKETVVDRISLVRSDSEIMHDNHPARSSMRVEQVGKTDTRPHARMAKSETSHFMTS